VKFADLLRRKKRERRRKGCFHAFGSGERKKEERRDQVDHRQFEKKGGSAILGRGRKEEGDHWTGLRAGDPMTGEEEGERSDVGG